MTPGKEFMPSDPGEAEDIFKAAMVGKQGEPLRDLLDEKIRAGQERKDAKRQEKLAEKEMRTSGGFLKVFLANMVDPETAEPAVAQRLMEDIERYRAEDDGTIAKDPKLSAEVSRVLGVLESRATEN